MWAERNEIFFTLPTFFSPIPEAPTILYGSLFLDGAGHAVLSEHRRESTGAEITYTTNFTYTITGGAIQFAVRCPANAMCVEPKGVLVNSHLLLDMTGGSNTIVYDYIVLMPD